jgi:hypothetical protein
MTTDWRALCAELLRGLDENRHPEVRYPGHLRIVMARTRAALAQPESVGPRTIQPSHLEGQRSRDEVAAAVAAMRPWPVPGDAEGLAEVFWGTYDQPEPVGPTPSDVTELFYRHMGEGSEVGFETAIAEALARWGRPASAAELEVDR